MTLNSITFVCQFKSLQNDKCAPHGLKRLRCGKYTKQTSILIYKC
jgi:hypothetical protein